MATASKLRFGVIGAGAFAEACHVPGLLSHPGAEVVAIAGRRPERARALAGRFGIPEVCSDPGELCARDDLDGITICTPNAAHREQALLAFAHGKHVFCEKPLGLSVAEAEEMLRAAEASGRVHQVAFTYRYLYGVEELRRRVGPATSASLTCFGLITSTGTGCAPAPPSAGGRCKAPAGGGALYDSGSHFFDLARFILGNPIAEVKADLQILPRPGVETDDLAAAWFRFVSGVRGQWFASRITPPRAENSSRWWEPREPSRRSSPGAASTLSGWRARGWRDGRSCRCPRKHATANRTPSAA